MSELPTDRPKQTLSVPVARLVFSRRPSPEDLIASGLLPDIRANGIRNDPLTRELDDGRHELLTGNGRAACAVELGYPTLRVVCLGKLSNAEALKVMFGDHQLTRTMPLEEKLKYLLEMKRALGGTLAEAGRELGLSASQVCKLANIKHLDESLLPLVYDGTIPASHAYLLVTVRDRARQKELGREVVANRLTRDELAERIRRARGGQKRPPKALPVGIRMERTAAGLEQVRNWAKELASEIERLTKLNLDATVVADTIARKFGAPARGT